MEENKQYISSVKMVNGSIYILKDIEAREALDNLFLEEYIISGGTAPIDEEN